MLPRMTPLVLAVDDNPSDVGQLREALDEAGVGAEIAVADSAERALELVADLLAQAPPRVPGMVVCDLQLPLASGADFVRRLRDDPRLAGVPAVLLTGHEPRIAEGLAGAGMQVRRKPDDFDGWVALAEDVRDRLNGAV